MSDEPDNILLNILRELRKDSGDLKQGQKQTNERLSYIEHRVAGFHASLTRFSHDVCAPHAKQFRIA